MILRLFERLRHALLPRELYVEHGPDMRAALEDRYSHAASSRDAFAVWKVLAHESRDLLTTAFSQYRDADATAAGSSPGAPGQATPPVPAPPRRNGAAEMFDTVFQDVRSALRTLRREPVMALVCGLTLALGIGAVTAVFAVVDAVLLEPLPYDEPENIVSIWTDFGPDLPRNWLSGPEFQELMEYGTAFEETAVMSGEARALTGGDRPTMVPTAVVSASLFDLLRVEAAHGRVFAPEDDRPDAELTVVLSDALWQSRFAGDQSILGEKLVLNGKPATVIGILPPDFRLHHPQLTRPETLGLWLPMQADYMITYSELNRGTHYLFGFGRVSEGASFAQASADLDAVTRTVAELNPSAYPEEFRFYAHPLRDDVVATSRAALLILLAAVGCVLLIACVNVANLQLARSSTRRGEIAVRIALGAGRVRILRQLVVENLVLAALGTLGGLVLAFWFVRALMVVAPNRLPRLEQVGVDLKVLAFAATVAALTALLFGLFPGVSAMRTRGAAALAVGVRGAKGGKVGPRLRSGLVVAEIALALVLTVAAGLMVQSFTALNGADPGYDTDSILTLQVPMSARFTREEAPIFWDDLMARIRGLPQVMEAGGISSLPLSGSYSSGTTLAEQSDLIELSQGNAFPYIEADKRYVTSGYFETMGMRMVRGRTFDTSDTADGALVAIVDEAFARSFWGDEDPIGKRVATEFGMERGTTQWREVVGLVRHSNHYNLGNSGRQQVYVPVHQRPVTNLYVAVRSAADPALLLPLVREAVWSIDADIAITRERTMAELASRNLQRPRFNSLLFSTFAGAALLLTAIGIYGVISFSVGQRTGEIGVRMALGANGGSVRRLVLRQSATLAVAGIGIGSVVALFAVRLLGSMLYGVGPNDVATYVGVAAILGTVALLASWIPAVRATRIEPVTALRRD